MIKIGQQCWDRAAEEMGGIDAEAAAEMLRKHGYDVEVINGDWGASYRADTDDEHDAIQNLPD